jgi:hypothetical protein
MVSRLPVSRLILAGIALLSLGACGRRGAPEPPPNPAAAQQQSAPADATLPSPVGAPNKAASPRTPFEKPKRPFILDPLL